MRQVIPRFLNSVRYAWNGFSILMKENNFRIHLFATLLVLLQAVWFRISPVESCLILVCIGMVVSAEAFNSSLEKLCDKVQPQQDPIIGQIKDMAAFAVLVLALVSLLIGLIIFVPHWLNLLYELSQ